MTVLTPAPLSLSLDGTVRLLFAESPAAGYRRLELLRRIRDQASISQAARGMRISYKTAWGLVETMNNLSPAPIVERVAGGKRGGGTRITDAGHQLIEALQRAASSHSAYRDAAATDERNARMQVGYAAPTWTLGGEGANRFFARVVSLQTDAVQILARMELGPGLEVLVQSTRGTFEPRARGVGRSALVHVSPTAIVLSTDTDLRVSADNQLLGTVGRLRRGAVQAEVLLRLPWERTLSVVVTNSSVQRLGLALRMPLLACFSADSVTVLGA